MNLDDERKHNITFTYFFQFKCITSIIFKIKFMRQSNSQTLKYVNQKVKQSNATITFKINASIKKSIIFKITASIKKSNTQIRQSKSQTITCNNHFSNATIIFKINASMTKPIIFKINASMKKSNTHICVKQPNATIHHQKTASIFLKSMRDVNA